MVTLLPSRQQNVLRATVHHYVDTIEPVSSTTLVKRFGLEASSATIRTAMGELEEKGLLTQPHTSAGRIPSPLGYRHYVDCLLPPPGSAVLQLEKELTTLSLQWAALDDLINQLGKRLTDFTGLMSLITKPTRPKQTLQEVRLVQREDRLLIMLVENSNKVSHLNIRLPHKAKSELEAIESWMRSQLSMTDNGRLNWSSLPKQIHLSGSLIREAIESHNRINSSTMKEVIVQGMASLASQPEFSKSNSFTPLIELLDNHPEAVVPINYQHKEGIWIGKEHPQKALASFSVVEASYLATNAGVGHVALIGPMRMTYATAKAAVRKVAHHLERLLS